MDLSETSLFARTRTVQLELLDVLKGDGNDLNAKMEKFMDWCGVYEEGCVVISRI